MKNGFDKTYKHIINEEDAADRIDRIMNDTVSHFLERMSDEELEALKSRIINSADDMDADEFDSTCEAANELIDAIEFIQVHRGGDI